MCGHDDMSVSQSPVADAACVITENSPLHPILLGNDHLSPAEKDLIQSSIAYLTSKVVAKDNSARNLWKLRQFLSWDLQRLDWELQRSELHGDALASAIDRREKVLTSGIRRLPSELLGDILFLTIGFPLDDGRPPASDPLGHELMKFEHVSKN
ncbi:hypothetical protein BDZ89DRAFT_1173467 [Hymenopellis radicata]|nr:hypothetical protein BDZ89DRAFT_1173467 [Hymenopellis radicata]